MRDKQTWLPRTTPLQPIPTSMEPSGAPPNTVEAILFDIYGTLFISASGGINLAQKTAEPLDRHMTHLLAKYDIAQSPAQLRRALYNAIDQRHGELQASGITYPEVEIDRVWMQVLNWVDLKRVRAFALAYETIVNPVYPMPHLASLLAACRHARKPMGIISNAQFYTPCLFERFLEADVQALGFADDLTIYSFKTGHGKPSPYLFQLAREKLHARGLKTNSVLFVGNDMLNDIYPAQQAGFQTALFAGDQRSLRLRPDDPRCVNLKPDVVITDLDQLLDHIA